VPLTELIGRDAEARQVIGHLHSARLVTLVGAGGVGKTRLALKVAQQMADDQPSALPDGVWFVDLSALSDPGLVPETVAQRLNVGVAVGGATGQSGLEALQKHLRNRALLLVLDNCEHLVLACAALSEALLQVAPALRLLATSRERLGLTGETVFRVPSLATPARNSTTPEAVRVFAAVELFLRRAQAVSPDFALTAQNAPDVARICNRLDGIPLAIEMAAARVRSLPPAQIATRLNDDFRLLTGGSRTALPRHQTLSATLEWSWNLLAEEERALLRRLSVFAGGWTLEAVEAVCAGGSIPDGEVFDLLESLADKSMVLAIVLAVAQEEQGGGSVRYRLLETTRQFAAERLAESGEAAGYRTAHRDYFLKLAEEAEPELQGKEQVVWTHRLESELNNLRAALDWSIERAEEDDGEAGLRLAGALEPFWQTGDWREGRAYLEAALAVGERASARARAKALRALGWLIHMLGDREAGRSTYEKLMAASLETGDRHVIAIARMQMGFSVYLLAGDRAAARAHFADARPTLEELGDRVRQMYIQFGLGQMAREEGDLAAARSFFQRALAMSRETGDLRYEVGLLDNLAELASRQRDLAAARSLWEQALSLNEALHDQNQRCIMLHDLSRVARSQGDFEVERTCLEKLRPISRELGWFWVEIEVVARLGLVALDRGDTEAAHGLFAKALAVSKEIDNVSLSGLELIAILAAALGKAEQAARLWGAVAARREARRRVSHHSWHPSHPAELEELDRWRTAAREAIGAAAFEAATAEGHSMTPEQAVEYALRDDAAAGDAQP
jgi:non-specific serine/threonine protein kinase